MRRVKVVHILSAPLFCFANFYQFYSPFLHLNVVFIEVEEKRLGKRKGGTFQAPTLYLWTHDIS